MKPPSAEGTGLIGPAVIRCDPAGAPETETRPEPPSPDAGNFVSTLSGHREQRTGSPDGIAVRNGRITPAEPSQRATLFSRGIHGQYLEQLRAKP